jgi:hypothetical protein
MTILETRAGIQHNIHLDVQLITGMVRLQALNLLDSLGEAHGEIKEDISLIGGGGEAAQVLDVFGRGGGPVVDDHEREEETAQGIEPPELGVESDYGEGDAAGIEYNVGCCV